MSYTRTIILIVSFLLVFGCKKQAGEGSLEETSSTEVTATPSIEGTASETSVDSSGQRLPLLEAYPAHIARALIDHARQRSTLPNLNVPSMGRGPQRASAVFRRVNLWSPAHVITVSFLAGQGSTQVRSMIAEAAREWSKWSGIVFDFETGTPGRFREWHTSDSQYASDIRIAFFGPPRDSGYWSLIGNQSVVPDLDHPTWTAPNLPSMNLEGFDVRFPDDWRAVVIHEFGHAIGYSHEIENPTGADCDKEINWGKNKEEAGSLYEYMYRIYGWDEAMVNDQMRSHLGGHDPGEFYLSPHDNKSIMHYEVPNRFCKLSQSSCCARKNTELSDLDKQGILDVYPKVRSEQLASSEEQRQAARALSKVPALSPADRALANRVLAASPVISGHPG